TDSENDASMVVTSLSNLLRATLDSEHYLITIENEINYVKEYIEIQKIRYKDKFEVEWSIDNTIMDYLITQITLQPIFENCIYHGIKPKKEKGLIRVCGSSYEDKIII
ncbi:histidine kinase, partial [Cutibacterium acnes]